MVEQIKAGIDADENFSPFFLFWEIDGRAWGPNLGGGGGGGGEGEGDTELSSRKRKDEETNIQPLVEPTQRSIQYPTSLRRQQNPSFFPLSPLSHFFAWGEGNQGRSFLRIYCMRRIVT